MIRLDDLVKRLGAVALSVLAMANPSFADQKIDLTEYLAPRPLPRDFKVFELSDASTRLQEVPSVSSWKKGGWQAVLSQEETDLPSAVATQFAIPGKKFLIQDLTAGSLAVIFKKPKTILKLRVKPGKTNRFRASGRALISGAEVGRGKYQGTWQFLGFEPLETPTHSWASTARVGIAASLVVKVKAQKRTIEAQLDRRIWFADGVGEVASEETIRVFSNGQLVQTMPTREGWLTSGVWNGLVLP